MQADTRQWHGIEVIKFCDLSLIIKITSLLLELDAFVSDSKLDSKHVSLSDNIFQLY